MRGEWRNRLDQIRIRDPRFLLLYSPLQFGAGETAKPDGSLSLAYVAGSLRRAGYETRVLDCAVGENGQPLTETFFRSTRLPSGLLRVGMSVESILAIAAEYDVIGISSIFTPQTTTCVDLVRAIREAMPEKLILAGGVNARNLRRRFFDGGVDVIALSEAEETIVRIAKALEGRGRVTDTPGIAFLDGDGDQEIVNETTVITTNLDELPLPAWDLLPLQQYWAISRPHGGRFEPGASLRYASLQTSRGCPFHCAYCHISFEKEGKDAGNVGGFRTKSIDRVVEELQILKQLGVEHIFLEDDSLFAKKPRAMTLLRMVKDMGFDFLDVNGVNVCHLLEKKDGKFDVDTDLIDAMADAGFCCLTLPFESASQRILDKYASGKWRIDRTHTGRMIRALTDAGIRVSGNYMIGYPCETVNEIFETIRMARRHIDEGLDYALFFTVVPFPGTTLFDTALRGGYLDPDFDPDAMRWSKTIMKNLAMQPDALESVRQLAWLTVNRSDYVAYKLGMSMAETSPPLEKDSAVHASGIVS